MAEHWESDSRRPRHPGALDDKELFVIEGSPKSPLKTGTQRPTGRSPKNALKKGKKTTSDFRAETCWNFGCMFTAARPHVDELHLRHPHGFLHCLNQLVVEHERACQQLSKNCTDCNCGSTTVFGTVQPQAPVVVQQRARPNQSKNCTCGISTDFCTVQTVYLSLWHNQNIHCRRTESEAPPRTRRTAGT